MKRTILLALAATAVFAQDFYEVRSLGILPSGKSSIATSINNSGKIAGYSIGGGFDDVHAFTFNNATCVMTDLGSLGGRTSAALAVSEAGSSFGYSRNAAGVNRAFSYMKGVMTDLGGTDGVEHRVLAVTDYGDAAVGFESVGGIRRAVKFKFGTRLYFPGYKGHEVQEATGINEDERVTGFVATGSENWGLVIDLGGQSWRRIPSLPANGRMPGLEMGALPSAINESGMVTGAAGTITRHAFRFNSETFDAPVDLGTLYPANPAKLSMGMAINRDNWVVGWSETGVQNEKSAFLHNGTSMIDLHTLLLNGQGWHLSAANGINDHGEIAGTGTYGGVEQAFVLLPRKFPQTLPGQAPGLCSPGNQQP